MKAPDLELFDQLKQEVAASFRQRYPECDRPVQAWRVQDVANFQEDLAARLQARISEKWFYTHLKPPYATRLPRIDMLDILSTYAGYRSWDDFVFRQRPAAPAQLQEKPAAAGEGSTTAYTGWRRYAPPLAAVLGALLLLAWLLWPAASATAGWCFVDADTGEAIPGALLEVMLLREQESPLALQCDSSGCCEAEALKGTLRLAVRAPYYHGDTIVRQLPLRIQQESIRLRKDDYALMIHLFSTGQREGWEKRRAQLAGMIADDARIFQVYGAAWRGMELYNKEEFIDKMTMPLQSLRHIEVIETVYDASQRIRLLRFTQKTPTP